MQFDRTSAPKLYSADDSGGPPGRLYFLIRFTSGRLPLSFTFEKSWQWADRGEGAVYLFLAEPLPVGDEEAFVEAAATFFENLGWYPRFAWVDPYDSSSSSFSCTPLGIDPGYVVARDVTFTLQNFALTVPAQTPLTPEFDACEITFGSGGPSPMTLAAGGRVAGTVMPPLVLGLTGALQGCLRFQLDLGPADPDSLDVGLRWFYAQPSTKGDAEADPTEFPLGSLAFPLFKNGLTIYPSIDPHWPEDETRTFFAFNAADAGLPPVVATAVPSCLRSTLGDTVSLGPLTGAAARNHFAALVFAVNQQASKASASDPLYLTPLGDFQLESGSGGPTNFMAGLSGVEYFQLPAGTGLISFFPGKPSFAEGFVPGEPPGATSLRPADTPTTSYAAIAVEGATLEYYAQPDQSVLYSYATDVAADTTITSLAPVPVQAASLTWPPPDSPIVFPLLPFAGLAGQQLEPFGQLESQVISPARRLALAAAPPVTLSARADGANPYSTTPQGLLASYVAGGDPTSWAELVLGRSPAGKFKLTDVDGHLLTAFQSNKLFLVVSNPAAIAKYLDPGNAKVSIGADSGERWNFDLKPDGWDREGTILLVKFSDLSVEQLAGQTAVWAFAEDFNASAKETSKRILDTIAAAKKALDAGDDDYSAFVSKVSDPTWNGVLALNVAIELDQLPSELQGLAVGIDAASFKAHHLGIDVSKIVVPAGGGPLDISDSTIFALIAYQAPAPLPPRVADWAFQVALLKVLFANSAVTAFSSVVDLQVNTLFGEPATLAPDNVIRLYGVYQKHVVNGQTVESYVFETQAGATAVFAMTSQVLNAVAISKAQFVTVTSESTGTSIKTQFLFWGLVDFKALASAGSNAAAFDVFSFGGSSEGDVAGLAFANLILDMSFDRAAKPMVPAFDLDASTLAIDMAASTPREDSLFQHFPLTVAGLTEGKQGASPTDLGFMGVQTPLAQSALAYPWYSVDFDLNLGTPGALAAKVGFVARLTAAWSPGSGSNYKVFVGLKLPGSSGQKRAISIESIFEINFKTLEIVAPDPKTFILVLYAIGFEFLSFTFPPQGQVNFALFGDPDAKGKGDASLGWYAAYAKPESKNGGSKQIAAVRPALGQPDAGENG